MIFWKNGFFAFFALTLLVAACTKPTDIGSDLLDDGVIDVGIVDTSTIETLTILGDSLISYVPGEYFSRYIIGEINDPVFGVTEGVLCAQATYDAQLGKPDFEGATLDSMVLVVALDTTYEYLNIEDEMTLDIHRIQQEVRYDTVHYSNEVVDYDATALASVTFTKSEYLIPKDVVVYESTGERNDTFPHIRVTLPMSLGQEFLDADYSDYSTSSKVLDFFHGFYIKGAAGTDGIIPLKLTTGSQLLAGIYVYYTDDIGDKDEYYFPFGTSGARVPLYTNNYSGSLAGNTIDNIELSNDVTMVQGTQGVYTKITLPYIEELEGLIVNKAELTFKIADLMEDDIDKYTPAPQLILSYLNEQGNYIPIDDVYLSGTNLTTSFGGDYQEGTMSFTMDMSKYLQGMIDGSNSNEVYLIVNRRKQNPNRVVLGGGAHETMAPSLTIYYSK